MSFRIKDFFFLPPEFSHWLFSKMIKSGAFIPEIQCYSEILNVKCLNTTFRTPLGLAAGFDKNGELIQEMYKFGFGFVEIGSVTRYPQKGNAGTRVFRLAEDYAIINRLGFNSKGLERVKKNINNRKLNECLFGVNIGCNANSNNRIQDYVEVMDSLYGLSDYFVINISSPNTPGLRKLHHPEPLSALLTLLMQRRKKIDYASSVPIFVKISPDLSEKDLDALLEEVVKHDIAGLVIGNTSVKNKADLISKNAIQSGGLSGAPIFKYSTDMLSRVFKKLAELEKNLILIGTGGISSGRDAYDKIRAGATLLQLYTAIIYNGLGIVDKINLELADLLEKDGFYSVSQAIGVDVK